MGAFAHLVDPARGPTAGHSTTSLGMAVTAALARTTIDEVEVWR
jgi:hypothetical protein